VVDEELRRIESSDGIERRGRVLALLMFTKQICNHPAQYLGESGPLPKRSGKLARTTEMLEEAVAAGDKALVFTQFREMGDMLALHVRATLGCEVVFLHGGTPKKARDEMVRRFQEEPHAVKHVLVYNDFVFADHSKIAATEYKPFQVFQPIAEESPTLYLGWEQPFPNETCSIYFNVLEFEGKGGR
jgi:hypothetical protein